MTSQPTCSLSVTLPLPPATGRRQRLYKSYRRNSRLVIASELARSPVGQPWAGPVHVTVRWYQARGRLADVDNITERVAAFVGGAQDAGLFVDDSQVVGYTVERHRDTVDPRVELVFCAAD